MAAHHKQKMKNMDHLTPGQKRALQTLSDKYGDFSKAARSLGINVESLKNIVRAAGEVYHCSVANVLTEAEKRGHITI